MTNPDPNHWSSYSDKPGQIELTPEQAQKLRQQMAQVSQAGLSARVLDDIQRSSQVWLDLFATSRFQKALRQDRIEKQRVDRAMRIVARRAERRRRRDYRHGVRLGRH